MPTLNEAGQIDAFILNQMQAGLSVQAIGDEVCRRFAKRYPERSQAIAYVADLSERFSTLP